MTTNSLRVSFALIAFTSFTTLVVNLFVHSGGGSTSRRRTAVKLPTSRQDSSTPRRQSISRSSAVQKGDESPPLSTWKSEPCERQFAEAYKRYCEQTLYPQTSNILPAYMKLSSSQLSTHLCLCVPDHLCKYK